MCVLRCVLTPRQLQHGYFLPPEAFVEFATVSFNGRFELTYPIGYVFCNVYDPIIGRILSRRQEGRSNLRPYK